MPHAFLSLDYHERWFDAVRDGDDERVAEMLVEHPELIEEGAYFGEPILHSAAIYGHEKIVARLLATRPTSVNERNREGLTSLDCAAKAGHCGVVAQLLAADLSGPIGNNVTIGDSGTNVAIGNNVMIGNHVTALHLAAEEGHDKVVALLLTARPDLIFQTTSKGETALHSAVQMGHEKVFSQLLTACPNLIDAVTTNGVTVLHDAARYGHSNLVARILALRPGMIHAVDCRSRLNALGYAVIEGHQSIAEQLLAIQPELIFGVTKDGDTILHFAVRACSDEFVAKLWRMNPHALHAVRSRSTITPFHYVVLERKNELMELFQWKLSLDEIKCAFYDDGGRQGEVQAADGEAVRVAVCMFESKCGGHCVRVSLVNNMANNNKDPQKKPDLVVLTTN